LIGIETADLEEDLAPDEQAGCGDGGKILLEEIAVGLAGRAPGVGLPSVGSDAADAENHPGVLDAIIGIVEFGADAADFRAEGLADHFIEPITVNDLEVVVEQADERCGGLTDAKIIDGGEVEFSGEGDDADGRRRGRGAGVDLSNRGEVIEGGGIVGTVIDDEDFKSWISGFGEKALDARFQEVESIAGGNDEGN
jgi:hypothetical protein